MAQLKICLQGDLQIKYGDPLWRNFFKFANKYNIYFRFEFFYSEHEFFDDESNYTQYYTAFAALAADKIMQIKSSKCYPLLCLAARNDFFSMCNKREFAREKQ